MKPAEQQPTVAPGVAPGWASGSDRAVRKRERQFRARRIVAPFLGEFEADVFRRLRTLVLRRLADRRARTLGVTSAVEGEGKSLVALNLAISLSLKLTHKVLLVELDLRAPWLHSLSDRRLEKGLDDVLKGDARVDECTLDIGFERLRLIPARTAHRGSSEIIASPAMTALARQLRNEYQNGLVIYDLPPLLLSDDSLSFMSNLDTVLLVVGAGKSCVGDVDRAMALIDHEKLIGTVLNGSKEGIAMPGYYYESRRN